jgi:nicotinamidase/pyrazinamidase
MARVIFWDVDTQVDFMRAEGKLYVPGSEEIIPVLRALTDFAHARGIPIVASSDEHELAHAEISATPDWATTFPPHCMRGTPGQRKIAETALRNPLVIEPEREDPERLYARIATHDGDFLLLKHELDVFSNANVPVLLEALRPEAIVLYGVATDFCDRRAIEGLLDRLPDVTLYFVTDAARAIDPARGEALTADWRRRGVRMVTSADVLGGRVVERHR